MILKPQGGIYYEFTNQRGIYHYRHGNRVCNEWKIGLPIIRVCEAPNRTVVTFYFAPDRNVAYPYYSLDYQKHLESIHIIEMNLDDDVRREVFSQCYHLAKGLGVGKLNVLGPSPELEAYAVERGFAENPKHSMPGHKWYTMEVQNAKYTLRSGE